MAVVRKKKASKKIAVRKSTDMVDLQKQIAAEAEVIGDSVGSTTGTKIKTAGKVFETPDGGKAGDVLRVIIVDFNSQNHYYEGAFNKKDPKPPVCFALAKAASLRGSTTGLTPSSNVPQPMDGGEGCDKCPMNQWKSAPGGGKLCKNIRRLTILPGPYDDGSPAREDEPMMVIDASPTALKRYDLYVKKLATKKLLPVSVVTELGFVPDSDQPVLTFAEVGINPDVAIHFQRRPEAQMMLMEEPNVVEAEPATKKKTTKKKTSRRRTA